MGEKPLNPVAVWLRSPNLRYIAPMSAVTDEQNEAAEMYIRSSLLLAVAGAMALAGCEPGGQLGDQFSKPSNTRTGAIAGALLGGAALGSRKGDDKLGKAAVGAVIGGAIGGLIGQSLDAQAADLNRDIVNDRVQIINEGNQLRVVMPEGILFATDSAAVNPSINNDLYAVADNLNRYPDTRVEVVGHTDNTGSAAYNQDLSERRAGAVGAILRSGGVAGGRIRTYGAGEDQPVASNYTPEGKAQNRRVEILIIPTQR
jgi:outer membrane protein OmpA-like peptidoglycan-associated protein